jgi:hypothetical protein
VRRVALEDVESMLRAGAPLPEAVAGAQRILLEAARAEGPDSPHRHPRHWAAWLAFGG